MAREPKTLFGKLVKDFEGWGEATLLEVRRKVKLHGVPQSCSQFVSAVPPCGCPIAYANGFDPSKDIYGDANNAARDKCYDDRTFRFSSGIGFDAGACAPPPEYSNQKSILFAIREALKNIRGRKTVTV